METYGAIILAGGRSTRMGSDKAALPFGAKRLLNHVIEIVRPIVSHLAVALNRDQYILPRLLDLEEDIDIAWDSKDRQGPLQGIADAVSLLKKDIDCYYVLSCDLPFLSAQWMLHLADRMSAGTDVVCTTMDGISNPLLALYRKKVLKQVPVLLRQNQFRPIKLWDKRNVIQANADCNKLPYGMGVNTREEFIQALNFLNYQSSIVPN